MKKTAIILGAVLLLNPIFCACGNTQMHSERSAMDFVKEMGVGINLGNTFEAYWEDQSNQTTGASSIGSNQPLDYETCWGAVETTQECIDGMAAAGFKTVRIPVYWGNMMQDDGSYTINEQYISRVQQVADWCLADDLYVVINMHHYDEFLLKNKEKTEVLDAVKTIWKQIAEFFKKYPDHLLFEGFNEALGTIPEGKELPEDEIYAYVNEMNQTFVDTVRSTGGNNKKRMLIASGYWTNIDNTTKDSFVMPKDSVQDRLMVSVHYIDNAMYWSNQIGGDKWLSYSQSQCDLLEKAFIEKNIPVFVGECTSIYDKEHLTGAAKQTPSSELLAKLLNLAVDENLIPVLWDVNDNFYSRTDYQIKNEADADVIHEVADRIAKKGENGS